jgi:hypothetical protein
MQVRNERGAQLDPLDGDFRRRASDRAAVSSRKVMLPVP